jgi:hypothetical protein
MHTHQRFAGKCSSTTLLAITKFYGVLDQPITFLFTKWAEFESRKGHRLFWLWLSDIFLSFATQMQEQISNMAKIASFYIPSTFVFSMLTTAVIRTSNPTYHKAGIWKSLCPTYSRAERWRGKWGRQFAQVGTEIARTFVTRRTVIRKLVRLSDRMASSAEGDRERRARRPARQLETNPGFLLPPTYSGLLALLGICYNTLPVKLRLSSTLTALLHIPNEYTAAVSKQRLFRDGCLDDCSNCRTLSLYNTNTNSVLVWTDRK